MNHLPHVSVVIATRNRPELLARAVDAVKAQDYDGVVDVTIVYDQSPLVEGWDDDSVRRPVAAISNDREPGLPGARNCGIAHSTGDLIAFCDDDDEWLPGKLRTQVAELQRHPETWMVTTGIRIAYDGETHDRPSPVTELTVERLVHDRTTEAHPSTFLFRRAMLERTGEVDVAIPGGYSEDYDFLLRAARLAPVRCVHEPLVLVRWHQSSFFADRWLTIVDAQRYMMRRHPEFADHRRAEARMRGQVAFALAASGRRTEAFREIGTVVRRWPLERRWPVALVVASGLVRPKTMLGLAHRLGKGI